MINVGTIDRALRFLLGAIFIFLPFLSPLDDYLEDLGHSKYALTGAGVVLLGTAIFRFCPAYALLGLRTCRIKQS